MSTAAKWVLRIGIVLIAVVALLLFINPLQSYSEPKAQEVADGTFIADVSAKVQDQFNAVIEELSQPFYALIMGGDTRLNTRDGEAAEPPYGLRRSDTMMLARMDPRSYKITLVTIPRDTLIDLDGKTSKINTVLDEKGPEGSMSVVEELTGVDVPYYFATDFSRFVKFVDAIGGVNVNVPFNMGFRDIINGGKINLEAGNQHLDGASTLVFSRIRKNYEGYEEACRQVQDRQVVCNIISAALSSSTNATNYSEAFASNIETNMSSALFNYYIGQFLAHSDAVSFLSGTGPYEGDFDEETDQWAAFRDPEGWARVMEEVDKGGDPTSVIPLPEIIQEF